MDTRQHERLRDIELFTKQRTHVWRTTLRSCYIGVVPDAVLNTKFGHSTEIANLDYADAQDLDSLADATRQGGLA